MTQTFPLYIPAPYQDSAESGRIILRDGSTATVRIANIGDTPAVVDFFHRLSPESRQQRFFSACEPTKEFVCSLCDSSEPDKNLTLVVTRRTEGAERVVAVGSYVASGEKSAEVAFAVEDRLQGLGLGTQLLRIDSFFVTSLRFAKEDQAAVRHRPAGNGNHADREWFP
jgi:GNAT superfamily N-acetyltransferase